MDNFPHGMPALADRIRDNCVMPVTMSGFFGGVENAGEHTPVGQSNANGFAEKGSNLLIGHASEISLALAEVAVRLLERHRLSALRGGRGEAALVEKRCKRCSASGLGVHDIHSHGFGA